MKTNISRQLTYYELVTEFDNVEESSRATEVLEIVKSILQGSWLSKFVTKLEKVILKSQNPEVVHFQDQMEANMKEQKMTI